MLFRVCRGVVGALVIPALLSAAVPDDLARQAAAAREANDLPRAIQLYRQGTVSDPGWQAGWWALGSMFYDLNRYADATQALQHLVQLNPQAGPAFGLLGLSEFEAGQYDPALKHLRQSLQLGVPGQDQMEGVLRFHQAELLTLHREFDAALTEYGWFVARQVHHDAFLSALGLAALHRAELPEKATDRDLALAAGKATYLSMTGARNEALSAFQQIAATYDHAPYVHFLLGTMLLATDVESAEKELRRELDIAPQNAPAQAMLAYILLEQDDTAEAAPLAAAAYKGEPEVPFAQYIYGRSLAESGDLNTGLVHLRAAVERQPNILVHHIALAAALAKAGHPEEARQERQVALALAKKENDAH